MNEGAMVSSDGFPSFHIAGKSNGILSYGSYLIIAKSFIV
jgi:hypothetical protein